MDKDKIIWLVISISYAVISVVALVIFYLQMR